MQEIQPNEKNLLSTDHLNTVTNYTATAIRNKLKSLTGSLLIFYEHDIIIDKKLDIHLRKRVKPHIPHLKLGETVIIPAFKLNTVIEQITKDAIDTVLAIYDVKNKNSFFEDEKDEVIKERLIKKEIDFNKKSVKEAITKYDKEIKEQITLTLEKAYIYNIDLLKDDDIVRIYFRLGIKNAENLVKGIDQEIIL